MDKIEITDSERDGKEAFKDFDMADYTKRTFSMFGGEDMDVTIVFANHLIGVVMDKFGKDIRIKELDTDHFSITADIAVSPQFYAWVFGLHGEAVITAPVKAVEGYEEHLDTVIEAQKKAKEQY